MNKSVYIHGYRLDLTCFACPEQYEVYDPQSVLVGYIRLRHGILKVHCPDIGGDVVYNVKTIGDGVFDIESGERLYHLTKSIEAIQAYTLRNIFKNIDYDSV